MKEIAIRKLLDELHNNKGLYGVKVTVSPSSPTERLSQFIQMDSMMKNYGQIIPLDIFLDLTDLPQKDEIKKRIQENQQAQAMNQAKGVA